MVFDIVKSDKAISLRTEDESGVDMQGEVVLETVSGNVNHSMVAELAV